MRMKINGYADAIEGKELIVKQTTRGMVNLQEQTGWKLEEIDERAKAGYGGAMSAFMALTNAGFAPIWEDLLDYDIRDFVFIKEPGDERGQEADAVDPPSSRADSDPGGEREWPPTAE